MSKLTLHNLGIIKTTPEKPVYEASGRKNAFLILYLIATDPSKLFTTSFSTMSSDAKILLVLFAYKYRHGLRKRDLQNDKSNNSFVKILSKTAPEKGSFDVQTLYEIFVKFGISTKSIDFHGFVSRLQRKAPTHKTKADPKVVADGVSQPASKKRNEKSKFKKLKLYPVEVTAEKKEFYANDISNLNFNKLVQFFRHLILRAYVPNQDMFRSEEMRNHQKFLIICLASIKEHRQSALKILDGNAGIKPNFLENLISILPPPGGKYYDEIEGQGKDKFLKKVKALTRKSKAPNHEKTNGKPKQKKISIEEFSRQSTLWLKNIEKSKVSRTYNTGDIENSPLSLTEALRESDKNVNRQYGGAYKTDNYKEVLQVPNPPLETGSLHYLLNEERNIDKTSKVVRPTKTQEVEVRQQQGQFRKLILNTYDNCCAISGYAVAQALQAAHIEDYSISKNNLVSNGLCLRADIHILFDIGRIRISEDYLVEVDASLIDSPYWKFNYKKIKLPPQQIDWPSKKLLKWKYDKAD